MKLRNKILMSAAALLACAATLTSTTFAWYVVNPTANATGMTGSTATASGSASIYVSKDGNNFAKNVSLGTSDYILGGTLDPITTENGVTFVDVDNQANTANYIQFAVWVKTSGDATVTPKITTTNTTGALTKQTAYQQITSAVAPGSEFAVDAVQAMRVAITQTTAANKAAISVTEDETTIYDLQAINNGSAGYEVHADSISEGDLTLNAHQYYTLLMGETDAAGRDFTAAEAATSWSTYDAVADEAVCFVFTIWLDGADISCFDSCVSQTFSFALEFTASAAA